MNKLDAVKILNISGDLTPAIIKTAYRKASALYHPDRNPAGTEMMKAVNEAYNTLKDFTGNLENEADNYGETLSEALTSLVGLAGLEVEVCGSWVWVTGETKAHKEALKENGFKWANKKKSWYLKPAGDKKRYRGNFSMDDIRSSHGSKKVNFNQNFLSA